MALEDILEKIKSDAEREAAKVKKEALSSARQITDEARKKGEFLKKEILFKAGEEAAKIKERILVNTQVQIKKDILSFKQKFIQDVLIKAMDKMRKSKDLYQAFLEKTLLETALGNEEIILSAQDRREFSNKWLEGFNKKHHLKLNYSKKIGKISGGMVIRSGKKEINAGLEILIKEIREKRGAEIAKILFGEL